MSDSLNQTIEDARDREALNALQQAAAHFSTAAAAARDRGFEVCVGQEQQDPANVGKRQIVPINGNGVGPLACGLYYGAALVVVAKKQHVLR